ncbi:hypothetical protein [Streptomyces sp. NPDC005281]|uniref:hypothetical protein n=1 Tax=Streptomyces sp. NPDC005281 TaxID=3155712 RepID=UPI0033BC7761
MNERRPESPGDGGRPVRKPVPRDPPDQQAAPGEDPLDIVGVPRPATTGERPTAESPGTEGGAEAPAGRNAGHEIPDPRTPDTEIFDPEIPDPGIPDTDEAGTGRTGVPHSGSSRPGHAVPDESSA